MYFLSIVESKSQTWYNPKELHPRCGKISGSASVKYIITLNLYECQLEQNPKNPKCIWHIMKQGHEKNIAGVHIRKYNDNTLFIYF